MFPKEKFLRLRSVFFRTQLKAMFGDLQMETLADIIQTALMLRINKRTVG